MIQHFISAGVHKNRRLTLKLRQFGSENIENDFNTPQLKQHATESIPQNI